MRFTILPFRQLSAAANMAVDAGMTTLAAERGEVLFRFYGWSEPALTFGYAQPLHQARAWTDEPAATVRRQTGGGVVDHRQDLTYALALPRTHAAASGPPQRLYRTVHACLSRALNAWGVATALAPCPDEAGAACATRASGACFQRAEPDDVVDAGGERKIAGAAMRRHARALLLQGSIERQAFLPMLDEPVWRKDFTASLADALDCSPPVMEQNWPEGLPPPAAVERFASPTWNAKR